MRFGVIENCSMFVFNSGDAMVALLICFSYTD